VVGDSVAAQISDLHNAIVVDRSLISTLNNIVIPTSGSTIVERLNQLEVSSE